jgi:hypothetical protein
MILSVKPCPGPEHSDFTRVVCRVLGVAGAGEARGQKMWVNGDGGKLMVHEIIVKCYLLHFSGYKEQKARYREWDIILL